MVCGVPTMMSASMSRPKAVRPQWMVEAGDEVLGGTPLCGWRHCQLENGATNPNVMSVVTISSPAMSDGFRRP